MAEGNSQATQDTQAAPDVVEDQVVAGVLEGAPARDIIVCMDKLVFVALAFLKINETCILLQVSKGMHFLMDNFHSLSKIFHGNSLILHESVFAWVL